MFLNEMNSFYGRFDNIGRDLSNMQTFDGHRNNVNESDKLALTDFEVERVLGKIKSNKASGPDGILGKVFKTCNKELSVVFRRLFQWSLDTAVIPSIWKSSIIIPIPKISKPVVLND